MRTASILSALVAATTVGLAQQSAPVAYSDPRDAALNSPTFGVQGEYLGTSIDANGTARPLGIQVVALADDDVRFVLHPGGLPGAGSDGSGATVYGGHLSGGEIRVPGGAPIDRAVIAGDTLTGYQATTEVWTARRTSRTSPTLGARPPAGAVVLFDGSNTDAFDGGRMSDDGLLIEGTRTQRTFRDFTLHLEFRLPFKPTVFPGSQDRGNSGLYIFDRYEVQILDSFGLHYTTGDDWATRFVRDWQQRPPSDRNQWGGALYLTRPPDVAMNLPPLTWQTYDIDFVAPRFDPAGQKTEDALITVRHNGVLVHDAVRLSIGTGAGGRRAEIPEGPLVLQEHANPVRFRNIWVVPR